MLEGYTETVVVTREAKDKALKQVERKIQAMILDLENQFGVEVESVRVDTRNFANRSVEIICH